MENLFKKYDIPAPRYTSYPVVPYWENNLVEDQWKECVRNAFNDSGKKEGISIYIHLPYCEQLCTYCGCNTRITVNHDVERPYVSSVLSEWKMYLDLFGEKPGIKEIHLGGGTPTFFSAANLETLLSGILGTSYVFDGAKFSFEAHPSNTKTEHLETLYRLGFRRFSIGVQDFDPYILDIINRNQTEEQIRVITEKARNIGYTSVNFDLVYGLPFQHESHIKKSFEKVRELRPDRIAFYSYAHVPWMKPGQRRYTESDLPSGEEKRQLFETGRKLLLEAGYLEIGMDHFALTGDDLALAAQNGTMHRNFMGYTPDFSAMAVALGVSSISDTWTAFAQNHKVVEDYLNAVSKNQFPVFRGHLLSDEDRFIRKHILNIMCRYRTEWSGVGEFSNLMNESVERLQPMVNDGLVEIGNNNIRVTGEGKPFLRNICMALDVRYWRNQPEKQVFSRAV